MAGESIRHGAFIIGGVSNTNFTLQGERLLDTRRLVESGRLLDRLRVVFDLFETRTIDACSMFAHYNKVLSLAS